MVPGELVDFFFYADIVAYFLKGFVVGPELQLSAGISVGLPHVVLNVDPCLYDCRKTDQQHLFRLSDHLVEDITQDVTVLLLCLFNLEYAYLLQHIGLAPYASESNIW